jgi:hypothetical protein
MFRNFGPPSPSLHLIDRRKGFWDYAALWEPSGGVYSHERCSRAVRLRASFDAIRETGIRILRSSFCPSAV